MTFFPPDVAGETIMGLKIRDDVTAKSLVDKILERITFLAQ